MITTLGPLHAWDTAILVLVIGLIALVLILNWMSPPRR
jgi:hypothetical protein